MIPVMFMNKKQKVYESLLNAEDDARQIRSFKNKLIASNAKGTVLFGTKENPFSFLKDTTDTSQLQKLVDSFCNLIPIETEIKTSQNVYQISVKKLSDSLLIIAKDKTADFAVHTSLMRQLGFMSDVLSTFEYPVYLTDQSGKIVYVNRAFCQLFHQEFKDFLGRYLKDYIYENCPDFHGFWKGTSYLKLQAGVVPYTITQRPFEIDDVVFFSGMAEQIHTVAPAIDEHIFQESPLPTIVVDVLEHRIVYTNSAFLSAFKTTEIDSFNQLNVNVLFSENTQELLNARLSKLLTGTVKNDKLELITAPMFGSKTFNVFVGFTTEKKEAFIIYLIDASERKNLEMQFAHAQKMQAIGQLAGGVAHDFNNLLTAIIGYCDLLLQRHTVKDPDFLDIMQIKGNANKASGLVGQLLTFSRKKPSKIQVINFHDAFVDLSALLQRSIAPFVSLKTDLKRNLGWVKMDPNQLTQIFLNLAVNAKDAMKNGGILRISATKEKFKKAKVCGNDMIQAGDYIKIVVADSGCGIAAEHLPHIFEPFFTTKSSSNASGTGLGLSTVYGVIRGAGGYISVDSERGIGTTFIIYLPRIEQGPAMVKDVKQVRSVFTPLQSPQILLVDDEDGVRLVVSRVLKAKGFLVTECANAEQALDILANRNDFDLLLTDMIMPGMDGETLIKQVKKSHMYMKTLLMSGYSEDMARHGSSENNELEFLAKPFELNQLLEKVKEVLQK